MRKYNLRISEKAIQDLLAIHNYIIEQSTTVWIADRILLNIREKIKTLENVPERTEPFKIGTDGTKYLAIKSGKYRIVYFVDKKHKTVIVVRITHVRQNTSDMV